MPLMAHTRAFRVRSWLLGILREARVMGYNDAEDLADDLLYENERHTILGEKS